eukprot:scaffold15022_cov48-Phaeocystis_antarctica.AAC.1
MPCSRSADESSPARRVHRGRPPPPAFRYSAPLPTHRIPFVRLSAGRVGVQPTAELRHLQRHDHGLHVSGALLPVHCPQSALEPSPTRRLHRGRPPPPVSRYSAPRLTSHALLSTLGRPRHRSTSR